MARSRERVLVTGLALAWGLRLGGYLLWRAWGKPEDFRYQAMRRHWGARFPIVRPINIEDPGHSQFLGKAGPMNPGRSVPLDGLNLMRKHFRPAVRSRPVSHTTRTPTDRYERLNTRPSRDSNAGPSAPEVPRGLFRGVRPGSTWPS